jgi:cell division protease FtsH
MKAKSFCHSGFTFQVDSAVLPALALSHLVGKDLRTAERLLDRFFLDLLMAAQDTFGAAIQQSPEPPEFLVKADEALSTRLQEAFSEVTCSIHLVSSNPALVSLVRRLLPSKQVTLQVVATLEGLHRLPPGGLVLIDALNHDWNGPVPFLQGLDHLVVRTLVDAKCSHMTDAWLQEQIIPVIVHPRKGIIRRQTAARSLLKNALETALFSRFFERCQASHLRWRTHLEMDFRTGGPYVKATLCFAGEERVLRAQDLKRDIPWGAIPSVRFQDVLGQESTKARLQSYLDWLKDPHGEPGLRACVLSGPPGTGKTHACEATAGEAGVPCILMGGSEFLTQWYGESERIIRETFASLQQYDAAVLVVDEFDAIAWARGQSNEWSAAYQSSIVGTMLRSIDFLRKGPGRVLLLATTNQYERIDPAIVRSMRMGDHIHVGLPTAKDRHAILQGLLKGFADDAAITEAVAMTTGLSPADLVQLVDRLKQVAAGTSEGLSSPQLTAALFDLRRGEVDSSRQLNPVVKRRVAYHEAGHALLAYHLLGPGSVEHLSVIPTASGGLGTAYLHQSESLDLPDADFIRRRLAVLLGGRVAEALNYPGGGPSCGAENDIKEATSMAQLAVGTWGLDPDFPMLSLDALTPSLQQALAPRLLERIQVWLKAAEALAQEELARHQASLELLVQHLVTTETLHRSNILAILSQADPSSAESKSESPLRCT